MKSSTLIPGVLFFALLFSGCSTKQGSGPGYQSLVGKFFPDHTMKVTGFDVKLLTSAGETEDVGTAWRAPARFPPQDPALTQPVFTRPELDALLQKHSVKIGEAEDAAEIARLISGLCSGKWYLGNDWSYEPRKENNTWIVASRWHPKDQASGPVPPVYTFVIDDKNCVQKVSMTSAY